MCGSASRMTLPSSSRPPDPVAPLQARRLLCVWLVSALVLTLAPFALRAASRAYIEFGLERLDLAESVSGAELPRMGIQR